MRKAIWGVVIGMLALPAASIPKGSAAASAGEGEWTPVPGKIMTRWAAEVNPGQVHPEYPRPQLVRSEWRNLNGLWEYAVRSREAEQPKAFDGRILVPFPIESALSGVGKSITPRDRIWYRRSFTVPEGWHGRRVLLNFEAVDWEVTVWINDREVGSHRGGYDPFSFDITEALKRRGEQEVVAAVLDPTNLGMQPRGKQVLDPHGIWYTAVTGIWQTVWLEPVEGSHISSLRIFPDVKSGSVRIETDITHPTSAHGVVIEVRDGDREVASAEGRIDRALTLSIPDAKTWSPDSPFLYDLRIKLEDGSGRDVDQAASYFGLRGISVEADESGVPRLFLNGEPLFQFGPLDQGWWPDGLYTPPSDEALKYDLEVIKQIGMNMLRKHVKIESRRFYSWCDRMGLLVWQDMPSGDRSLRREDSDLVRTPESAGQFRLELSRMIESRFNHPSIVMWVPFNEGWGQFDSSAITGWIQGRDPTRLVDTASGWADRGTGDVHDIHSYPGPAAPPVEGVRAAVLGEFGGLGLPVTGHTWQDKKNWGYRSFQTSEELTRAYLDLIEKLAILIDSGLSAAVYTQTTDVEIEVNGLMTYDREIIKMDRARVRQAGRKLYDWNR